MRVGASMTEWLVVDFESFVTVVGLNPARDIGFFHVRMLSKQLDYGTMVVLLRCLLMPEIMHKGHQKSFSTSKTGKSPYNLLSFGTT